MEEKTRFTVITKILGICSILFSVIGFYVLLMYSENISLAIWNMIYMIFIPMGGFFNLLDFGTTSYSKAACFSYALALILRLLFDITIAEEFHWDFLLMLTFALFVSVLRCHSVLKQEKAMQILRFQTMRKPLLKYAHGNQIRPKKRSHAKADISPELSALSYS